MFSSQYFDANSLGPVLLLGFFAFLASLALVAWRAKEGDMRGLFAISVAVSTGFLWSLPLILIRLFPDPPINTGHTGLFSLMLLASGPAFVVGAVFFFSPRLESKTESKYTYEFVVTEVRKLR